MSIATSLLATRLSQYQRLSKNPLRRLLSFSGVSRTARPARQSAFAAIPSLPSRKQVYYTAAPCSENALPEAHPAWQLTVGIEIHAQLNTDAKLFSGAHNLEIDEPNVGTAPFDLSMPGAQPIFQAGTILPALRAAIALNCEVQRYSQFDRKHYFYHDQPAGYQITQFYAPFAKNGYIVLDRHDGIAAADGDSVTIGIKQIQLEQDTAKTVQQPPSRTLIDFNRVGRPLLEIITLPQIHHPQTAAACVRKIQSLLQSISAVTTGMELGGLRADINVSVLQDTEVMATNTAMLGQRTEVKNLSSLKSIEDAIVAEEIRQIELIKSGGQVVGETRGWNLGSTTTRRLRGKEGEVDYRYMPDPDLPPLTIGEDLIAHLTATMPKLPDELTQILVQDYGLPVEDARTLVALDGGARLDLFHATTSLMASSLPESTYISSAGKIVANWVLHELGGLLSQNEVSLAHCKVTAEDLAAIITNLQQGRITGRSAKQLLSMIVKGEHRSIEAITEEENMAICRLTDQQYDTLVLELVEKHPDLVQKTRKGQLGKMQWFVGQMVRNGRGNVEAQRADQALKRALGLDT